MQTPQRCKILAVDDNRTNLAILRELLAEEFDLITASTGAECLTLAERHRPELILLDIMMPGLDGYETCRRLRASESVKHTKIIMLSAKAMVADRVQGYAALADDYITKPFDCDEFLSKIRVFLRLQSVELARDQARQLNRQLEEMNAALSRARDEAATANNKLAESNSRLEGEIAQRRAIEDRLRHDALHDALTNLPNRMLIADRIEQCIHRNQRLPESAFAVLFIDLDNFKVVNDSLGHRFGDRYLIEIAHRLVSTLRATDCVERLTEGTAARIGGDEFVVLLDGLASTSEAAGVAARVQTSLSEPIVLDGNRMSPSASIGIALGSKEYCHADEILRDADTALYRAKELGKRRTVVFDAEMRSRAIVRMRMEVDLRKALESDELFVQYQPIVVLSTGEIKGFEALVRWNHPRHGVVLPGEFIALAEHTGLIVPLGEWVLRKACQQTVDWRRRYPSYADLSINVNLSSRQLAAPAIVENIDAILRETGLDRSFLNIELTETVLMENASPAAMVLKDLAAKHTEIHMDDFGTGYSSLSYLGRLPIAAVKLDRSFVLAMSRSEADRVAVKAVLDMAHSRGLRVVAEGVETAEQATWLLASGCDYAQGFYFSKPVNVEVVERMLMADTRRLVSV